MCYIYTEKMQAISLDAQNGSCWPQTLGLCAPDFGDHCTFALMLLENILHSGVVFFHASDPKDEPNETPPSPYATRDSHGKTARTVHARRPLSPPCRAKRAGDVVLLWRQPCVADRPHIQLVLHAPAWLTCSVCLACPTGAVCPRDSSPASCSS